jgi:hypothetical protein
MICAFIFYFASRSHLKFKFELSSNKFEFVKNGKIERLSFPHNLFWAETQ